MIDHPNPLRILPVAIFIIFLLTEGLCRKSHSKNIILESNGFFCVSTQTRTLIIIHAMYKIDLNSRFNYM